MSGPNTTDWRRSARTLCAGLTAVLVLGGCGRSYHHRYVMTVEVEVDGVVHRASAVQVAKSRDAIPWAGSLDMGSSRVVGESVAVDLGRRGLLIATLRRWPIDPPTGWHDWLPPLSRDGPPRQAAQSVRLDSGDLPLFVTFLDPRDPRTVRLVDPTNLAATFGPSVKLKAVTVASDRSFWPAPRRLETVLPWLADMEDDRSLDGERHMIRSDDPAPASHLDRRDFERD